VHLNKLLIYNDNTTKINRVVYLNFRIVIPVVVGSSPISHPKSIKHLAQASPLGLFAFGLARRLPKWVLVHAQIQKERSR